MLHINNTLKINEQQEGNKSANKDKIMKRMIGE
jgi:hypothetical protein